MPLWCLRKHCWSVEICPRLVFAFRWLSWWTQSRKIHLFLVNVHQRAAPAEEAPNNQVDKNGMFHTCQSSPLPVISVLAQWTVNKVVTLAGIKVILWPHNIDIPSSLLTWILLLVSTCQRLSLTVTSWLGTSPGWTSYTASVSWLHSLSAVREGRDTWLHWKSHSGYGHVLRAPSLLVLRNALSSMMWFHKALILIK